MESKPDSEVDTSDIDDPYLHATCANVTPFGTIQLGTIYKTICGKQVMYRGPYAAKCPECSKLFRIDGPCPLCGERCSQ